MRYNTSIPRRMHVGKMEMLCNDEAGQFVTCAHAKANPELVPEESIGLDPSNNVTFGIRMQVQRLPRYDDAKINFYFYFFIYFF
jgi:hypothetical protein